MDYIRRFLRNPFYYGHFEYAGELYEGKHPPIITKQLFDKVQAVLEGRTHHFPQERQPKPLAGLFRCGKCGMAITAEVQKGHTYYRCTRKSKVTKCTEPFIREEVLAQELSAILAPYALPDGWADEMLVMLENERKDLTATARSTVHGKQAEIAEIGVKMQRLVEAYLEQLIDRPMLASQKAELLARKKTLQEQIEACEDNNKVWLEPYRNWIQTAKNMGKIAVSGSLIEKKAAAAQVFGSNLYLDSKKARGSASKPWSLLMEKPFYGGMVPSSGIEPLTSGL